MKIKGTLLALLTALLMLFCLGASALTLTDEDIPYPMFPWREYTLRMTLCTDDAKAVDSDQANLLVKLACFSDNGEILYSDIEQYGAEFFLKDQNNQEHPPVSVRVRGVSFKDGKFSTNEMQKEFELLYALSEGSWNNKLALIIGEKSVKERPIVRMLP